MNLFQTAVIILLFIATFIALGLTYLARQRRSELWSVPFTFFTINLAIITLAQAIELSAPSLETKTLWLKIHYSAVPFLSIGILAFTLAYYSQAGWRSRKYAPYFIIPIIGVFVNLPEEAGLFWQEIQLFNESGFRLLRFTPGLWYWITALHSYLLGGIAILLISRIWLRTVPQQRQPATILIVAIIFPGITNFLYLTEVVFIDLSPLALTVTGGLFAWDVLKLRLFEVVPISRRAVLDYMRDAVIVLDTKSRIADVNVAGEALVRGEAQLLIGKMVSEVIADLAWLEGTEIEDISASSEIKLNDNIHELQVSPLYGAGGEPNGRLLIFHNITNHKRADSEVKAQRSLLQNLIIIARATSTTQSLQATLQNILDVSVSITQAEYGSLFVLNNRQEITSSIVAQDEKLPFLKQRETNQKVMEEGLFGWVLRNKQLALIENTSEDDRWLTLAGRKETIGSALSVPIMERSRVLGILTLTHSEKFYFKDEHSTLLQGAADQMSLSLHNAQLFDKQSQLAKREHILFEVIRDVGQHLDTKNILQTAVNAIIHYTAWPSVVIFVAHGQELLLEAVSGMLDTKQIECLPISHPLIGEVYNTGQSQIVHSLSEEMQLDESLLSAIVIPLRQNIKTYGVIATLSSEEAAFTEEDERLLASLAEAIALALANAELHQNVQSYATDLDTLIEASRDGIIYLDMERRIRVINETAVTLLGLPEHENKWANVPIYDLIAILDGPAGEDSELDRPPKEDVGDWFVEIASIVTGTEPTATGELTLSNHMLRWLSLPLVTSEEGKGRLYVLRDITEERQLEQMREDLIHMTVHDMRNPLSAQSMAIDVLAYDLPESQRPVLEVMNTNNQRMLNLVNNILDVSRLESKQMPLNYGYVDLSELFTNALERQSALAKQKFVRLESEVLDGITTSWMDDELMARVLQNLIGNAVKFTPYEGLIKLTAESDPASFGEMIRIAVCNTGEGIPADIRERLFDKFATGKQDGRGSGIGLAFCKMVIEAHNGRIWAESEVGKSATFYFTIPSA